MTNLNYDLSIIIPAYNEAQLIAHGLASMREHLEGIRYEIVVVDNGSRDETAAVAAKFSNVRVISIEKSTIGKARNIGAQTATGRLFAFLDADVMVTARWAEAVRKTLAAVAAGADYYGGFPYDIPPDPCLIERAWFVASSVGKLTYIGSANLVVSASVFRKVNGFDESLVTTEDMDFGHRIRAGGQPVHFDPELHAIHLGFPRSLRQFVKREMWHGSGSFRSLASFLKSKVSVAAALTGVLLLGGIVLLAFGYHRSGLVAIGLHLVMPAIYVIYRFQLRNWKYFPSQYVLGYLYLGARAISGIRSLLKLPTSGLRAS
jgi:glycosyltransferase involved in cell wall biosynthesis